MVLDGCLRVGGGGFLSACCPFSGLPGGKRWNYREDIA